MEAFEYGDTAKRISALEAHSDTVTDYVISRFTVTSGGAACTAEREGDITETFNQEAPTR